MKWTVERGFIATIVVLYCVWSWFYVDALNLAIVHKGVPFTGLKTWVDDYIPFIPQFIFPYYFYYIWVLASLIISQERKSFYHMALSFTTLQTLALITFYIFPSQMQRPEVLCEGLSCTLVRWIYLADANAFNIFPSLHVGHSTLVACIFYFYGRKYFPIVLAGSVLISLSTVFIKQHYVVDIPLGFIYALFSFHLAKYIVYHYPYRSINNEIKF